MDAFTFFLLGEPGMLFLCLLVLAFVVAALVVVFIQSQDGSR